MADFREALGKDIAKYKRNGGEMRYPFPVEDFALKVFGLDVQYEDFDNVFESSEYEPNELFGCLFPDGRQFQGMDRVILVNTNRAPFTIAGKEINKAYYVDFAERQTIAHEIGHYSDRYCHNRTGQQSLFLPAVTADDPVSIIVYPKNAETFANKYARSLLMPEGKVIELIHVNNLEGTFDLNSMMAEFSKAFAVTRYMIEIRLHELNIHFTNGVYIKSLNRYRSARYTESDLLILLEIAKDYALKHGYYDADNFCQLYNKATGQARASGPLYMALWRIFRGHYDHFPRVFEKRVGEFDAVDLNDKPPEERL